MNDTYDGVDRQDPPLFHAHFFHRQIDLPSSLFFLLLVQLRHWVAGFIVLKVPIPLKGLDVDVVMAWVFRTRYMYTSSRLLMVENNHSIATY